MAKYNDEDIIWRTIGGRRVPIRKGQSLSEAMKESGKFKKSKTEVKDEQKKFEESDFESNDKLSKEFWEKYAKIQDEKQFNKKVELNNELNKWKKENGIELEGNFNEYKLYKDGKQISYLAVDEDISKEIKRGKYLTNEQVQAYKELDKSMANNLKDSDYEFYKKNEEINAKNKNYEIPRDENGESKFVKEMTKSKSRDDVVKQLDNEAGETKTYKSLNEAKNEDSDWRKQIESNNAQMEKDVTDLQNKINEYRTKSAQSDDALKRYQYLKEADNLQNQYYERFRQNERANAKLKKESPNEKYEYVDTYATYKDKFNDTWGKDGSSDKVVSASMYTNDEFMEHLEDSNWHSERRQLLDANLTNQELKYIKDRTKVSAWGVENLTGKEQVSQLIKEAKDKYKSSSINDNIRRKAYQKYLKEHPNSKMKFEEFKDMRKQ